MKSARIITALLALFLTGCGGPKRPELWIYTSIYRDVLDGLIPKIEQAMPDVTLRWYKAGSEEVAARVTAELAAGACNADVLVTADTFWYESLASDGLLGRLPDDILARVPQKLRHLSGLWTTSRAAVMVMAYNSKLVSADRAPRRFSDLTDPTWKGRVVIGDPLKSGTHFATVSALVRRYGWSYYEKLRVNETLVEGGNSAVLRRIELGERPVGVILLENILKVNKQGLSPARSILPDDGAVLIPSPVAILASTRNRDAAERFCRFMLSSEGQRAMVSGYMHPIVEGVPGPEGAPSFAELLVHGMCPTPEEFRAVSDEAGDLKEKFAQVMFE